MIREVEMRNKAAVSVGKKGRKISGREFFQSIPRLLKPLYSWLTCQFLALSTVKINLSAEVYGRCSQQCGETFSKPKKIDF